MIGLRIGLRVGLTCRVCYREIDPEDRADDASTIALVGAEPYAVCPVCRQIALCPRERNYRARVRRWLRRRR